MTTSRADSARGPRASASFPADRPVHTPTKSLVVITVDTEPDDAWANHQNPSVANVVALEPFQALLREFGARATYLTTYRVAADDDARDTLLRYMEVDGAEIGAHLHPWETPPFLPSGIDTRFATFPHEIPLEWYRRKLEELTGLLEKRLARPVTYRAGRWGLAAEHLGPLEALGYLADTSVIPWVDWTGTMGVTVAEGGRGGVNYQSAPLTPYHPDYLDVCRRGRTRLLELPVSVDFTRPASAATYARYGGYGRVRRSMLRRLGLLRPVWATPAEESLEHLTALIGSMRARQVPFVNLTIHSSELSENNSPATRTGEMTRGVFARLRAMLSALARDSRFEFATLSQAARAWNESAESAEGASAVDEAHERNGNGAIMETSQQSTRDAGVRSTGPSRSRRVRLAYILAASHSGSTLTAMLLGAHPDVVTAGEMKATNLGDRERYHCSCRRLIRDCPFWVSVSAAMNRRGFDFDITDARTDYRGVGGPYARRLLSPLHRGSLLETLRDAGLGLSPTWRRDYARMQARNAALAQSLLEVSGRGVIVDSSKVALRLKYLLRNPELDVRVVRTVRDGRGVALTYMDPFQFADASDPNRRGGGTGAADPGRFMSASEAAYRWRRSNQEAESLLAGLDPAQVVRLCYEELCADPLATVRKVFSFLGVDPSAATLDFRKHEHHVVGNGMRLDTASEVRLDERWRTVLTPRELADFDRVAGDMNRSYGYR